MRAYLSTDNRMNHLLSVCLLLTLLPCFSFVATAGGINHSAQRYLRQEDKLVTGIITDALDNSPLPGVNILVKNTLTGTTTNSDGSFTLRIPASVIDPVLVFSYLGYLTEEVPIKDQKTVVLGLVQDIMKLDEVVVIGYGESSRKLLSSSISTVQEKELNNTISGGIEGALQGKTSGVQIVQNSGTPGASISVTIRGKSSISAGNQPLYVIDGIPIITGDYGQISFEGQNLDASIDLNPNNIESISILKDASAAAIYGARAGNGVILITTKKGLNNKASFSFNGYTGWQKEWKRLDMMNAAEWKEYVGTFDPDFVSSLNPDIDTDWQDEVFRVAPISNYDLSVKGGNQKTRYFVSGRYFDQTGILLGSDYNKLSGRVNLDFDATDRLKISAKTELTHSLNNRIVGDQTINGVLPNAISKPPVYAVRNDLGEYLEEGFWDNPVAIGNEVTNEARVIRNISSFDWTYDILADLSFTNQWGIDIYNLDERRYEPTTVKRGAQNNGIGISARSDVAKLTQQSTLNYKKTLFAHHNLNIMAGYSFERIRERYNWIRGNNFPSDNLEYLISSGNIEEAFSNGEDAGLQSFFGRLMYNYNNKYLFTFNFRHDGSSNFGANNRYASFPGFSFAWRLSEEPFMEPVSVVSELKLKVSYGLTGNDRITPFASRNLYESGYNYNGGPGTAPKQIPNPDLKWETTANFNAGFELALFESRISLGADYYFNKTTDLLLSRPLPGSAGFPSVSANIGALQNQGLELMLTTLNTDGRFKWTTNANFSLNRNKVLKLFEDQPITDVGRGGNAVIVGEPIGIFYMYRSLGVDPSTGDLLLDDVTKDGQITDADRTMVADPNPDFIGGVTNTFEYKGFDLNVFFQFSYGNDIFNGTRQYAESMKFGTSDNQLSTVKSRWKNPGDQTFVPRHDGTNNLFPLSSHYIEDGSYLRLKDLTLGYTIGQEAIRKTRIITSMRVYVKFQNLITLTPYSGYDPEINYGGVVRRGINTIRQGTDFFTYPQPRTYSIGVSMNF